MIKEKFYYINNTITFFAILFVTSTITSSASINNYFKDKDEDNYEKKFYREKYKEEIYSQGALCDDPQAIKKYGEICKGHGNSFERC